MEYEVRIAPRAERNLARIYLTKDAENSKAARLWYLAFKETLLSLRSQPERCPPIPKDGRLRQLDYGNKPHIYRIIYRIQEKQKVVEILHIRHGARDRFEAP